MAECMELIREREVDVILDQSLTSLAKPLLQFLPPETILELSSHFLVFEETTELCIDQILEKDLRIIWTFS